MTKPKTIEEWNALAAKIKSIQPASKKATPKHKQAKQTKSITPIKSLPLHFVNRSKKGKFKITSYLMTLLWKKRGYRVFEEFTCLCCNKPFSEGWRYVVDDSRVYLCIQCKADIKPQLKKIIYTPMK